MTKIRIYYPVAGLLAAILLFFSCGESNDAPAYDLVIYGGTSAGIAAAIQAKRMDRSVILIEPSTRIGGLTTGGLGQTDIGNKSAIGGISREFYSAIKEYYDQNEHWKWQEKAEYKDGGQTRTAAGEASMWTFEPSAALSVYEDFIEQNGIELVMNQKLDRSTGVQKEGTDIQSIRMLSGETYRGKIFIDATYEGDLLATAGVSYTVGRESNDQYRETLNGVHTKLRDTTMTGQRSNNAVNHNFVDGVDPYVVPGDATSGLLPYINPDGPGTEGAGDDHLQAYCFRMCLTDHPDNRIPFEKPADYDEKNYELLLRNYEAGEEGFPWINSQMPNRKTDTNNRAGFSTDFIGQNYNYPEASYEEREVIREQHRNYQKGLMWTLAYHPRMPDHIREGVSRWGTCKDEFAREDGWQEQLYVREARRMVGPYVMTQYNCEGIEVAEDPVGMGAYGMDSHHTQRYVTAEGWVKNEGNVEAHVKAPYPISYRSIVPKSEECTNLLVPVCLSATHIAFGSIRMEPVFMVLGQSAATAASLAIDREIAVQDLPYAELQKVLLADKQVLEN
ncbi:FAD-dependent oxidoreductase [Flavilitoribacter nigricans]|uniref:Xanthan lyase n=1 Tax=Flavilitoribacter nigricans (strain ATCC 23147 / DSM 23189 / NBRC 102662 / NCIMB 1420 / SS-2) TaxID=1122177 RepID=A0A2D0NBV6_FLAN2|nr:FAD-dependent oxidoreductase [Flavilitoribacter nigricans]PHN05991.1 xanthan lyase [Flavilitoribacter nigricans DSM 23189 = NBRC 102662]